MDNSTQSNEVATCPLPWSGFTGYEHMDLNLHFWRTIDHSNAASPLVQWLTIGEERFNIPVRVMALAARLCKWFFKIIQRRLTRSKQLREALEPIFCSRIVRHFIRQTHPFRFTGVVYKTVPFEGMGATRFGLCILDTQPSMFSPDELDGSTGHYYAFANLQLRSRSRVPFAMLLFINENLMFIRSVGPDDYADTGPDTPAVLDRYRAQYGSDHSKYPGRYIVNLHLPTDYNPLPLPIMFYGRLQVGIGPMPEVDGDTVKYSCDVGFLFAHFTHEIVKLRTLGANDYNWSEYGMYIRDGQANCISTYPLIARHDDISSREVSLGGYANIDDSNEE